MSDNSETLELETIKKSRKKKKEYSAALKPSVITSDYPPTKRMRNSDGLFMI